MGYEAKKTEHSGPKRGNGAYWGYKCEAKQVLQLPGGQGRAANVTERSIGVARARSPL
jgi:hypothetical protein